MSRNSRARHRIGTLVLSLVVLLICAGYLARFSRTDFVTGGGVGIVAAEASTGIVVNAMSLNRDR